MMDFLHLILGWKFTLVPKSGTQNYHLLLLWQYIIPTSFIKAAFYSLSLPCSQYFKYASLCAGRQLKIQRILWYKLIDTYAACVCNILIELLLPILGTCRMATLKHRFHSDDAYIYFGVAMLIHSVRPFLLDLILNKQSH